MARQDRRRTRSETVHDLIRADILGGRLRHGQRLKFPELSEHYGASTGAVREALRRLAAKNLVSSEAHHGFQATAVTAHGLADPSEVRAEVESLALARAVGEGDLAWQGAVLAAHHTYEQTPRGQGAQPSPEWLLAHSNFHVALLAGRANVRLRELTASLREEAELYRCWSRPSAKDAGRWTDQDDHAAHRALLDAVLARDAERAQSVLRSLIRASAGMELDPELAA